VVMFVASSRGKMFARRWLAFVISALFAAAFVPSSAGVSKEVTAHIKCAVCKQAVKAASQWAKEKNTEDEDELTDGIDGLCSAQKDAGKWTTKIDIVRMDSDAPLKLDRRDQEGVCRQECKAVQRACRVAMKGKQEDLVELLKDNAGVGKLQRDVCKKACAKAAPKLAHWEDEAFLVSNPDPVPTPPPPTPPTSEAIHEADVKRLLPAVITSALGRFGSTAVEYAVLACCPMPEDFPSIMKKAIDHMMEKTTDGMRKGLSYFGVSAEKIGHTCTSAAHSASCVQGQKIGTVTTAANRLIVQGQKLQAGLETIEYVSMELLRFDGHDLHKVINKFLEAWQATPADGDAIGKAFGDVFKELESKDSERSGQSAEL